MAKRSLIKELEKQESEELLRLLEEVSRRFPVAEMYLRMEFGFEAEPILEKYRKALTKEYFPSRGRGKARVSRADRILKEFALVSAFPDDLMDMHWFQLHLAIRYHLVFGHDYEPFIKGIHRNWQKLLGMASESGREEEFRGKAEQAFDGPYRRAGLISEMLAGKGA